MPDQPAPRRAYHAEITVQGDTHADFIDALREITDRFDGENLLGGVSGGSSSGYAVKFSHDPAMTHDAYMTLNRAWLEARRAERNTGA